MEIFDCPQDCAECPYRVCPYIGADDDFSLGAGLTCED